jgi:hypothetical protein
VVYTSRLTYRNILNFCNLFYFLNTEIRLKGKGKGKRKCKFDPRTGHENPERELRFSSTISLTSALDRVGGQRHVAVDLTPHPTPGKTQYPLFSRLGGPQGRSERVRKVSPPPEFDPRTVQSIAIRYTDWTVHVTTLYYTNGCFPHHNCTLSSGLCIL